MAGVTYEPWKSKYPEFVLQLSRLATLNMLAGISSCTTGQTGTQGGGKLAITSQRTAFFSTAIRSNLEKGASVCEGVRHVMLQARVEREKCNTRRT